MIRRMLADTRGLDRDSRAAVRLRFLALDEDLHMSVLDLSREGRFGEAEVSKDSERSPEHRPAPLSREAQDSRRPPAPVLLLEADQGRPRVPAKARTVVAVGTPKEAV